MMVSLGERGAKTNEQLQYLHCRKGEAVQVVALEHPLTEPYEERLRFALSEVGVLRLRTGV